MRHQIQFQKNRMDDETIDKIFQGVLEDLPRPTRKVKTKYCPNSDISGLGTYF